MVSREVRRFARFMGLRTLSVGITLILALTLVIVVANLGGKLDELVKYDVESAVGQRVARDPVIVRSCQERCVNNTQCVSECIANKTREQVELELKRRGLDQPFFPNRLILYLRDAITLKLSRAMYITSDSGSREVWDIIVERLPNTILLFTTVEIIIFTTQLFTGLSLSRKYGALTDKIAIGLAPLSSMPGWFYGLFLLMIFAFWLRVFPTKGMVSVPPPEDPLLRALDVMWHMVLPILSWMIAYIPIGVYYYRTFFLMFSTEEYVEYARARGLPSKIVERRYILRPTLPPIITSFVLLIIGSWMGALITERVFNWPGLGSILAEAIGRNDAPVIIGVNTVYAYLLAISVIILDLIYGIVDPRVRVGGE